MSARVKKLLSDNSSSGHGKRSHEEMSGDAAASAAASSAPKQQIVPALINPRPKRLLCLICHNLPATWGPGDCGCISLCMECAREQMSIASSAAFVRCINCNRPVFRYVDHKLLGVEEDDEEAAENPLFDVHFHELTGMRSTLQARKTDTIEQLKKRFQIRRRISPKSIQLVCNEKRVDENEKETLEHYGIVSSVTIHVISTERGD
jgi:hypothetical protein